MLEKRLPDGVTAIVTNPPYGRRGEKLLIKFIEHALELLRPVGGMLALLVPIQWAAGQEASELCQPTKPEHVATVVLADRINWIGIPAKNRGNHNHCWLVWDMSRPADHARSLHVRNPESRGLPFLPNPAGASTRRRGRAETARGTASAQRRGSPAGLREPRPADVLPRAQWRVAA